MEALGCHCIAEFTLTSESVLKNLKKSIEERSKPNMFYHLFAMHQKLHKITEIWEATFLYSDQENIQNDLCMRNLIQSCLSYKNPKSMFLTANRYLNHMFELKPGTHQKNLLSGMIDQVLNLDSKLSGFKNFFNSNVYNDIITTTFIDQVKDPEFPY